VCCVGNMCMYVCIVVHAHVYMSCTEVLTVRLYVCSIHCCSNVCQCKHAFNSFCNFNVMLIYVNKLYLVRAEQQHGHSWNYITGLFILHSSNEFFFAVVETSKLMYILTLHTLQNHRTLYDTYTISLLVAFTFHSF